ncbi:MAG: phosphopantetheine-binding protein [Oscillospiraceae bacterium]|nr:phosphopantetheine-binding protein [Oscillospiraceae bacterium]
MERISRAQPGELRPDTDVFEEGYLDSFAAVEFIVALSEMFGVALDIADVSREMIATPEKATLLIEGRRQL